jgi:hypothetical protein
MGRTRDVIIRFIGAVLCCFVVLLILPKISPWREKDFRSF